jgi:hypothetical protein
VVDYFGGKAYGIYKFGKFSGRVFEFGLVLNDKFPQGLGFSLHWDRLRIDTHKYRLICETKTISPAKRFLVL